MSKADSAGGGVPQSIDDTLELLQAERYVADRALATVLFLALKMGRPVFLEGEAGVGKTEIAKVLRWVLGGDWCGCIAMSGTMQARWSRSGSLKLRASTTAASLNPMCSMSGS